MAQAHEYLTGMAQQPNPNAFFVDVNQPAANASKAAAAVQIRTVSDEDHLRLQAMLAQQ